MCLMCPVLLSHNVLYCDVCLEQDAEGDDCDERLPVLPKQTWNVQGLLSPTNLESKSGSCPHLHSSSISFSSPFFLPTPFPIFYPPLFLHYLSLFLSSCPFAFHPPFPFPEPTPYLVHAGGLWECCKIPQRVRTESGRQTICGAI